jgi:hypothetical protein
MVLFEISELIAALMTLFLGIASLFLVPHWVPARLMERAPDFGGQIRVAGVVLILVALILFYEIAEQMLGAIRAC